MSDAETLLTAAALILCVVSGMLAEAYISRRERAKALAEIESARAALKAAAPKNRLDITL